MNEKLQESFDVIELTAYRGGNPLTKREIGLIEIALEWGYKIGKDEMSSGIKEILERNPLAQRISRSSNPYRSISE